MYLPHRLLSSSDDVAALSREQQTRVFSIVYWLLIVLAGLRGRQTHSARQLESDIYVLF